MVTGSFQRTPATACTGVGPSWRQCGRRQRCSSGPTAVCHAASTNIDQAGTDFAEDKIPEGPLMLDYMQQMEHDSKFEDSPVSEAGEVFGEYTPFSFITFAEEEENWCTHEFSRVIDAPMEQVKGFFDDWNNIPAAFDLIDTLIVDGEDSDAAQLMLFYRFRRTPPLQILTTLHKERSPDGTVMSFSSDDGMPLAAMLRFEAAPDARSGAAATTVSLVLQYALPNVLVEYIGKFGVEMHVNEILKQNLEVCQKLIEGDVTLETLGDWYAENRTDAFDGNTETELAEEFANIPDHVSLELDVYQDEEDKRQHETFVHNMEVMKELVDEGRYKQTEEGWVRADVDGDEASAANEVARYYRYFHDQPENADQEQMANVEEMLRYLTYSAGWQGLDGPPDAESRPFDFWDGVDPHWRGDARRGEVARGEHATPGAAAATSSVEGEVVEAEVVGGCEEAEKGSVTPAGDGGEGAVKRQQPQTLEDIDAMTKEEALNSVRAMGDSEDFDDDVQYPPVPMERLGVPLQEGEGRRHGYVVEPWRDAIDVALEDDGPGPEDPEAVREHGVQLAEALRRMRVAREAAAASGEEFTAGAIEEEEVEELPEEAAKREAVQQDFAAAVDGDVGKALEESLEAEYEGIAIVDEEENVLGTMPMVTSAEAARMGPGEVHDYMTRLAGAAGMKEEFQQMIDDAIPKEEVQQDVLETVTGAMQWQRETAADAGMTTPEFHKLNTMYQEVALGEMVQEMSEKMGVDAGRVMSTALMFTDRTRADAERVGLTHDEYLGAICETMDDLNDEEQAGADRYGLDIHTYRDIAAGISSGATQKAEALDMTEEEYEAYAWSVVMEAKRRGLSCEDRVEGVTEEELAAGLKEIEVDRATGGPWSDDGKPAPWDEEVEGKNETST